MALSVALAGPCLCQNGLCGVGRSLCQWRRGLCPYRVVGRSLSVGTRVESLCRRLVEVAAVHCGVTAVCVVRSRAGAGCARQGLKVSVLMLHVRVCVLLLVVHGDVCAKLGCLGWLISSQRLMAMTKTHL